MCRGSLNPNACFQSHLRLSTPSKKPALIGCAWDRKSELCVNKVPAQFHPDTHRFFHSFKEMNEITKWERLEKEDLRDFIVITTGVIVSFFVGVYAGSIVCAVVH